MDIGLAILEFYVSLVAYTILHMIFVISSDFVEAFNIPPLNIGIYVDKLAAIRALLMVIADLFEWGITQKGLNDYSMSKKLTDVKWPQGARRIGSLISYFAMLCCRIAYLWIVYKSDNKSLSVFITLCIEGFWFGTFQMGFFAIGPEYNAFTSLGIHTMGNFIFFLQLILQHRAKKKPKINCLFRVRVHGWICLITSIIALCLWIYFCVCVTAAGEDSPREWPGDDDVWSPFLLFIIGAFAEDFAVPGVLPFAFLDPDKANLVNYLTPVFFMSGAVMIVLWNDWVRNLGIDLGFKDWSASTYASKGLAWHSLWLLNIPKYIAFFIAMWSIHGTFEDLRCIIQSRWRVLLLTMFVVVPRATLEVAGYVGVANWAIGRADSVLVETEYGRTLAANLKDNITGINTLNANQLQTHLNTNNVKKVIASWVKGECGATVEETGGNKNINISADKTGTGNIKVTLKGAELTGSNNEGESNQAVATSNDIKVEITLSDKGWLTSENSGNTAKAKAIADKIAGIVALGALANKLKSTITNENSLTTTNLKDAIDSSSSTEVKNAINDLVKVRYEGATVNTGSTTATDSDTNENTLKVELTGDQIAKGEGSIGLDFYNNNEGKGVKVSIKIDSNTGNLKTTTKTDGKDTSEAAAEIALAIKSAALGAANKSGRIDAFQDFGAFAYIAYHDILAMFCRFVYGKFAVGYNWTIE